MTTDTIHLGFEVGSGNPVSVPLRNLAVTGQTQESGKTTTLEALVSRAGVTALAFVTKRGESSFVGGRRIQPYFRDRADWQFVTSIIDATLQEKNKFLRPWIMKICRTTRTLAEVQAKIREALKTAKGVNEGVYTQLDAYLDLIVPEIKRTPLAANLDLRQGVNVMDVSASPTPMQMLFVQSALDWINEHSENTVVVVPEAWEFIPEGKGSPVKHSAETLVRKGSGIGNRIWVDSQDMAGVDKMVLRGCPVWLIGVQREANEIKRNLSNIPAGIKKPTAAAVAMLERGQFYACFGKESIKAYVQPSWMSVEEATNHARGIPVPPSQRATRPLAAPPIEEPTVNEREAQALRDENNDLRSRVESLERQLRTDGNAGSTPAGVTSRAFAAEASFDNEAMYQAFKARLIAELPSDPTVMRIVTSRPELVVQVERSSVAMSGSTLAGRLAMLTSEGFFDEPTTGSAAYTELRRLAFPTAKPNVYRELDRLATQGFLTKEEGGFRAVQGMKINIIER